MTKRALTILLVAILVVGGATAVIASSIGGSDPAPTHAMPNGQTMKGDSMDNSQRHSMSDGQTMSGSEMDMEK